MIKQVPVSRLRAGMHLHKLDGRWNDHPFWRRSFVLAAEDVRKVCASGVGHAWIDTDKGLDVDDCPSTSMRSMELQPEVHAAEVPLPPQPSSAELDGPALDTAMQACTHAVAALRTVFADIRLGKALDAERCTAIVQDVVRHVMGDPAAMILVTRLKNHDDYSHMHSVAVCALMVALARQMGMDARRMREAGLAGLLHDVGKLLVPAEILNKPGPLTPAEYTLVKTHVRRGHALLVESGSRCEMALDVCLHHHERMDGSGYPHGLKGRDLSLFTKMASVCDVYDALTSRRPHRSRQEPGSALRQMAAQPGQFDPMVLQSFVRTVGIYPVGSLVRLRSQQLAIVVAQDIDDLLKPRVKPFFSIVDGQPIDGQQLALAGGSNGIIALETPESLGPEVMKHLGIPVSRLRAA
jgi:HD-GYP domain-containing protein (c-di-GMP phosphodiesterase class II)